MSSKQKLVTPEIFRQALVGSFAKLNPRYMMKNPVMFVVEIGFLSPWLSHFSPACSVKPTAACVLIIWWFPSSC